MAILLPEGKQSFTNSAGVPLVGGKLYTYDAGTSNPRATYSDAAGTVPNANPVILDARGEATVFWSGTYKVVLKDALDNTIWTVDGMSTIPDSGTAAALQALLATAAGAGMVGTAEGTTVQIEIDALQASVAANAASITALQAIDNDLLQQAAISLAAGTATTVACFGDSTMWGADPANLSNQVAVPSPVQVQNFVNNFFGNAALTVTNNAISGTTATQMIAGTDGSGSTFATKMAASGASVVYCNHGVNDAFGGSATTLAQYKTALLAFVSICRQYSKVPVLVTPFPCLTIGNFGSQARAAATARFAQAMRDVADKHGVKLVDNFRYLQLFISLDGAASLPLAVLPDGVHGTSTTYGRAGNNLCEALLDAQAYKLTRPNQRVPVSGASSQATAQAFNADTTSRAGVNVTTGTVTPQSLRMVLKVDEVGMDLYLAHPVFAAGSSAIALSIDGLANYNFSQQIAGFNATFWHDFETLIARNIEPGFHILIFTTSATGGVGVNYLRTRQAAKPLLLPSGFAAPSQRTLMAKKLDNSSGTAGTQFVSDDIPVSRLVDGYELEWTGQMQKDSGLIVGGNIGTNGALTGVEKAVIFGLNGSGFLAVSEATAPATFGTTVIGAVDLSVASHLFRVNVSTAGLVTLYVDDVQIGTYNLVQPYYGGLVGLWKNNAAGTLTVTDVCRVWRL